MYYNLKLIRDAADVALLCQEHDDPLTDQPSIQSLVFQNLKRLVVEAEAQGLQPALLAEELLKEAFDPQASPRELASELLESPQIQMRLSDYQSRLRENSPGGASMTLQEANALYSETSLWQVLELIP